jgi:hypothetical protein
VDAWLQQQQLYIIVSQHVLLLGVFWLVYKVIAFAGRYCSFTARMGSRHGGKHITDDAPVPPRQWRTYKVCPVCQGIPCSPAMHDYHFLI